MSKKMFFGIAVSIFCLTSVAHTENVGIQNLSLKATIDYTQKFMWRGFDLQDNDPALQADLVIDIGETGFYSGIWTTCAMNSEWREWDEVDFYAGYYCTLREKTRYAVEADASYTYLYFPRYDSNVDAQQIALTAEFPKIFPSTDISQLTPYAGLYYGWPVKSGPDDGLWVKLGMNCDLSILPAPSGQEKRTLGLYVESFRNDGAQGSEVNPGWSHIAAGASTTFEFRGMDLTPGINYQWTLEETVNEEDEFWFTFSISYAFKRD